MIEVAGEGAKYWPRWRGPSGQGHVPPASTPTRGRRSASVWKTTVPGRGNSSPIVWGDRIFLTTGYGNGERLSMLAFSRADGKQLWETFIPQSGVEYVHYEERLRVGDADHRRQAGLRVVRPPRPVRVRLQRQDRLAAQVRHHRQLSRARRIAGALQGSHLHLPGCESGAGADGVRRRVRQGDRQADLADAARAKPSGGARPS